MSTFISKLVLCIQVDLHWMACNGFVDYSKGKWVLSLVIFSIQCSLFFHWLNLRESLIHASSFQHWFLYVSTIMLVFWENSLIFFLFFPWKKNIILFHLSSNKITFFRYTSLCIKKKYPSGVQKYKQKQLISGWEINPEHISKNHKRSYGSKESTKEYQNIAWSI